MKEGTEVIINTTWVYRFDIDNWIYISIWKFLSTSFRFHFISILKRFC